MRKYFFRLLVNLFAIGLLSNIGFAADQPVRNEVENVLKLFKNYRFGSISVWKLNSLSDIRRCIKTKEMSESGVTNTDTTCVKNTDPQIVSVIQEGVTAGDGSDDIAQTIVQKGLKLPDMGTVECVYQYFKSKEEGDKQTIQSVYVITTRQQLGQIPDTLIGLIISYEDRNIESELKSVSPSNIYTINEMQAFALNPDEFGTDNLYKLVNKIAFVQGSATNMTNEAQGLGTFIRYAPEVYGKTKSIIKNESNIQSEDIQQFIRISDGQAFDYLLKQHEVILSPDLISWRKYPLPGYYNGNDFVIDSMGSSNVTLPTVGLELRYGNDDINFPSFWSERITASAIWQSVKIGVILPTDGWASVSKDWFSLDRMMTHAGIGVVGSFDFPIKVVTKSGVFHLGMGYVFGDAEEAGYKDRSSFDPTNYDYATQQESNPYLYNDYLVRGNAQLLYTFGVAIDQDYWFRFGIGASMYNAENWHFNKTEIEHEDALVYEKGESENVFGVCGKIEFMSLNVKTPFGAGVQYFDEGLSANIWLQVPVIDNLLAVRLDAKGFFKAFKDEPRPWEKESAFIPMARVILTF